MTGIALYAGEGYKTDGKGGFANTDPSLIKFMTKWFQEFCNLPITKLRGAIWIHENLDYIAAKSFWSKLTGIPEEQFHKTYISVNKKDSKKIRKNIHQYGVFAIRFSNSQEQRRIMGWISALLGDKMLRVHQSAVAQR